MRFFIAYTPQRVISDLDCDAAAGRIMIALKLRRVILDLEC